MDRTFMAEISFTLNENGRRECLKSGGDGCQNQSRQVSINADQLDHFSVDRNGTVYAGVPEPFDFWPLDPELLYAVNPSLVEKDVDATRSCMNCCAKEESCGCVQEEVAQAMQDLAAGNETVQAVVERLRQVKGMQVKQIAPGMVVGSYSGPNPVEGFLSLLDQLFEESTRP